MSISRQELPSLWDEGYARDMVTVQLPVSEVDELTARARQVSLGKFLLTLFLGTFYALGWTAGTLWLGIVMSALAIRRGWKEAVGVPAPRHKAST